MRRHLTPGFLILVLGLILAGCDTHSILTDDPVPASMAGGSVANHPVLLRGYEITLVSVSHHEGNTTFEYRVKSVSATHNLEYLVVGLSTCSPALELVSTSPSGGEVVIRDGPTGIPGVKIQHQQSRTAGTVQTYSVTLRGLLDTATVGLGVKAGPGASSTIAGAGCHLYNISGSVFWDGDEPESPGYGVRDADEIGIPGVVVHLLRNGEIDRVATTDATGTYSFDGLPAGTYLLRVPESDDDANTNLYQQQNGAYLIDVTTADQNRPASLQITLGPDASNADFGFRPNVDEVTNFFQLERQKPAFHHWAPLIAGSYKLSDQARYELQGVNQFDFSYLGYVFDGTRTTYHYEVAGTGEGHDLSHITFELDDSCPVVAHSPLRQISYGLDPTTGVNGIKFDNRVRKTATERYTLTFDGPPLLGVIRVGLKNGPETSVVDMPGACVGPARSATAIEAALDRVFFDGGGDNNFFFLEEPFFIHNPTGLNRARVAAALALMQTSVEREQGEFSLAELKHLLVISELILFLGFGTGTGLDAAVLQFSESVVNALIMEQQPQTATQSFGVTLFRGGTGGSNDTGKMLESYAF